MKLRKILEAETPASNKPISSQPVDYYGGRTGIAGFPQIGPNHDLADDDERAFWTLYDTPEERQKKTIKRDKDIEQDQANVKSASSSLKNDADADSRSDLSMSGYKDEEDQ